MTPIDTSPVGVVVFDATTGAAVRRSGPIGLTTKASMN